jgi:hypothetical protein
MSGVGLTFTPLEPELAIGPESAFRDPVGLGEAIGAGYRGAREMGFSRDETRRAEGYGIYMDPIGRALAGELDLPYGILDTAIDEGFNPSLDTLNRIRSWVEAEGTQYGYSPEEFEAPDEVMSRVEGLRQEAADYVNEQNEILGRANPGTALAGQLIGGVGAEFTDPINVLTLPLGAPARAGLATVMAVEAGLNAGIEVMTLEGRNRIARELGQQEQGYGEAAMIGALFGATGAATMRGLEVGTIRGLERIGRFLSQRELRALAEAAAGSANPSEAALGNALLQDLAEAGQVGANTSRVAEEEHQRRLAEATRILNEGGVRRTPNTPAALRPIEDDPGGRLEMADIREIAVDTERATGTRRITQPWDDNRAGVVAIFENADGSRILVDGRSRLAAAQQGGITALPARIYREADGFSLAELRDVIDQQARFQDEPLSSAARVMEAMHDDLFDMVASGSLDPAIATVVARAADGSSRAAIRHGAGTARSRRHRSRGRGTRDPVSGRGAAAGPAADGRGSTTEGFRAGDGGSRGRPRSPRGAAPRFGRERHAQQARR